VVYRPDGLQQERTILAWRRCALGFVVISVLITRTALVAGQPVIGVAGLATIAVAVLVLRLTMRRRPWRRPSATPPHGLAVLDDGRLPALIAGVAMTLCCLIAALVWLA
jgi:uncharacterized membrane protein YidH (DUF202 family)